MSPGLPGLGLGGLFFIVTALLAPAVELVRTVRGRSSVEAWRVVVRQFAIAVVMIIAVDLTIRGALLAESVADGDDGASDPGMTALPMLPLGLTAVLLCTVIGGAKALELAVRVRDRGLRVPRLSRALAYRAVPGAGIAMAVWLAMLLFGAAELSPASGDRGTEAREPVIDRQPPRVHPPAATSEADTDAYSLRKKSGAKSAARIAPIAATVAPMTAR
jgi:hypothetical protein